MQVTMVSTSEDIKITLQVRFRVDSGWCSYASDGDIDMEMKTQREGAVARGLDPAWRTVPRPVRSMTPDQRAIASNASKTLEQRT